MVFPKVDRLLYLIVFDRHVNQSYDWHNPPRYFRRLLLTRCCLIIADAGPGSALFIHETPRPPVVLPVRLQVIRTNEQFDQHDAGDKPSGMSPEGDAALGADTH
jgi:hypothetical protein